jgi:hypothetical protein
MPTKIFKDEDNGGALARQQAQLCLMPIDQRLRERNPPRLLRPVVHGWNLARFGPIPDKLLHGFIPILEPLLFKA